MDRTPDAASPQLRSKRFAAGVPWVAALTVLFSCVILQYSSLYGRLLYDPTYDDVGYLNDGLERLSHLHRGGIERLVREYVKSPPHSPGSSLTALLGFALFGPRDWGPYVCQAAWVFGALLFVMYLMRKHDLHVQLSVCLFALTLPLLGNLVFEFRPDLTWGFLCTLGVFLFMLTDFSEAPLRRRLAIGLVWGLALWFKPSAFPLTAICCCTAALASCWVNGVRAGDRSALKKLLTKALPAIAACSVVGAPHFLLTGTRYPKYLWTNLIGPNHQLYALKGNWFDHLTFYLTGPGGSLMLGNHFWIAAVVVVLACVFGFRDLQAGEKRRIYGLALVTLVSITVPMLSPTKSQFIGATFFWLFAFLTIYMLDVLLRSKFITGRLRTTILLSALLASSVIGFKWPQRYGSWRKPETVARRQTVHGLCEIVALEQAKEKKTKVYWGVVGVFCNSQTVNYVLLRDFPGSQSIDGCTVDLPESDELLLRKRLLSNCNVAITADDETGEEISWLPNASLQSKITDMLNCSPDFVRIASIPTFTGKFIYVYRRKESVR